MPVGEQISLFGSWLYELGDDRTIGSIAGIEYESCCWRVQLFNRSYLTSSEQVDHSFLLKFELKGLGGIDSGGSAGTLIDGYEQREQLRKAH
jgi:LPS-assembly protein